MCRAAQTILQQWKAGPNITSRAFDLDEPGPNLTELHGVHLKPIKSPKATVRPAKGATTRERQPTSNVAHTTKNRDDIHSKLDRSLETKRKKNERRSHDELLLSLDQKENLPTSPSERATRLSPENECREREKPTITHTKLRDADVSGDERSRRKENCWSCKNSIHQVRKLLSVPTVLQMVERPKAQISNSAQMRSKEES